MKKKTVIILTIITLLLIPVFIFAQDNTTPAANTDISAPSAERLDLGMNAGIGISQLTSGVMVNGENVARLNYHFSFRGMYFFSKHIGIVFDLGNHFLRTKEESTTSSYYKQYDLQYIFLDFSPVFTFKKIYLYLGVYIGFIVKGEFEDSTTKESNTNLFSVPDFGLCYGVGYTFDLGKGITLLAGIELKNQINNFQRTGTTGSKIFSAYLNIGLLFNVK